MGVLFFWLFCFASLPSIFHISYFQFLACMIIEIVFMCVANKRDEDEEKMLVHFIVELNKNLSFIVATLHAFNSFDFGSECICFFFFTVRCFIIKVFYFLFWKLSSVHSYLFDGLFWMKHLIGFQLIKQKKKQKWNHHLDML